MNRESIIELIDRIGFNRRSKNISNRYYNEDDYQLEFYDCVIQLFKNNGERVFIISSEFGDDFIEEEYNKIYIEISALYKEKLRNSKIDNIIN